VNDDDKALVARGLLVGRAASCLNHGGAALSNAPEFVRQLLDEGDPWRRFQPEVGTEVQEYGEGPEEFERFIRTPPTKGLGATPEALLRVVGDDLELRDKITDKLRRGPGRPASTNETRNNITGFSPTRGTSLDYTLRHLREMGRDDLYQKVVAGELSGNAAMVTAGKRREYIQVRSDDMRAAVRTLRSRLSPFQLVELIDLLSDPAKSEDDDVHAEKVHEAVESVTTSPTPRRAPSETSSPPKRRSGQSAGLTEDDVRQIRRLVHEGETHQAVANRFGVTRNTVGDIVHRRTWADVPDDDEPAETP
jgi:hypothetical protein